jgi:hypothetical protein
VGSDRKLTVTLGGQKNDICFNVIELSTGEAVPGALIRAYDPNGDEVHDVAGQQEYVRTGSDGRGCGSFTVRQEGSYRFTYVYYGDNSTNAEGGQTIEAIDRGRSTWQTMDGREMQCKGDCVQLGFASSGRRAAAASVIDDIINGFKSLIDGLVHGHSTLIDKGNAQQAAASDGSPSATLFHAQADNGIAPALLNVKGTLKAGSLLSENGLGLLSEHGMGIITHDGGSLTGVVIGSLITNDGGSLVVLQTTKGVGYVLVARDGHIISNDGASLITNDGGSILSTYGGGLVAPAGGAVVMIGSRAVIANANGVLANGTLISNDGGSAIPVTGAAITSTSGSG